MVAALLYPLEMFNHYPQSMELVEHPMMPIYSTVT
jgi:hypothetical protein